MENDANSYTMAEATMGAAIDGNLVFGIILGLPVLAGFGIVVQWYSIGQLTFAL